jgi:membrane protein
MSWQRLSRAGATAWQLISSVALEFWKEDYYTKASTLTFYTLQSIVPFLAAALAIAKGFGFDNYLEQLVTTTFVEQKEVLNYAIDIALAMLKQISSGEIVGVGALLLLWTNINLVGYIERVLNDIWHIRISRSIFQRSKDFLFAIVVFPLIFVASSSITLYLKAQLPHFPYLSLLDSAPFLPWLLSCVLFGILYFLIPVAKICIIPRLIASILAGTAFQLWQLIFINLQLHIFNYNVVYGAFALLPLFLIWLQFSWIIALIGALIAAHLEQHLGSWGHERPQVITAISECELGLLILTMCLKAFYSNEQPLSIAQLADQLGIAQSDIIATVTLFEEHEILFTYYNRRRELCCHPLNDPERLRLITVCDLIHNRRLVRSIAPASILTVIRKALTTLHEGCDSSAANIPLYTLVETAADRRN